MHHPLIDVKTIEQMPEPYIQTIGEVFARFDENTQDSGNISYGVRVDQTRYFIKTAGRPNDTQAYLEYPQRVALLRNAVRLKRQCSHTALPRLYQVIESPEGPLLVYEWLRGKLLHATSQVWNDPNSAFQRFRRLPASEILAALDVIYELHHELAQLGWIAVDFYDGCLIYDFAAQRLGVMDLDTYHQGPFINEMGRMFGSSRFMAPEEFERGAKIDQRTTSSPWAVRRLSSFQMAA